MAWPSLRQCIKHSIGNSEFQIRAEKGIQNQSSS
jgi:hypothetical protein